jgi:hypothetical protein
MKIRVKTVTTLALAGLIGGTLSISPPLHAQDSAAGQEMHQSGASAKAVVSAPSLKAGAGDAADSVKHAYRGGLHPNFQPVISRVRRLFRPPGAVLFAPV